MAFQWFMNDIFSSILDVCVVIYLYNILIYSNNMSEYHWHIKEVLKHLYKAGLYAKVEKCKFYSKSVEYLGYILFPSGLTMSNDKVKIIQDWPEPKKVKDNGLSTFSSSTLSLDSILVILVPNWTLLLDSKMSILKRKILAIPQSTLTTSNLSSLKNNLWPSYKLLFFFFLFFI